MGMLKKLFDMEYKELKKFEKIVDEVELLDEEMQGLKEKDFAKKTLELQNELSEGAELEDVMVRAFALAREAAHRAIGEKPYRVQMIGGLAIHYGNIAEMKTGEGKTLTTVLPAYLNSLSKKGVHVITTNEYLSQRNAEWMEPVYNLLGITVGVNLRSMSSAEKKEVYEKDITYSTNNEIGFDYLRDNMVVKKENRTIRELNFCIIDEVDSILIDEARTPLIISGGRINVSHLYQEANKVARALKEDDDFTLDIKTKNVSLTEEGSHKVEKITKIKNLYEIDNTAFVQRLNQSLKANYGFKKDVDYVVENDEVVIVDQFTGRLMQGRQFSEGLHQAIEAKENVSINTESRTMATITFQNLFRMYNKLSGMTGTAKTEEEEFRNIYNMYVITIPTNKPVIREDHADLVYSNIKGKNSALIKFAQEIHKKGQPILIGTVSVEANEELSKALTKAGLKHEILNAKNHEREAEIIANAGEKGAITLATNMAGRGTDIKVSDSIKEIGGLCVLGTERHESRRIDNQLRGRAGRQGDPGLTQFFVSFEDDLMRRFGANNIKSMLESIGVSGEQCIKSKALTKSIESAQRKVEGNNYDIRKNLLDFDNVLNEQREILYERRNEILDQDSIHENVIELFENVVSTLVDSHIDPEGYLTDTDYEEIVEYVNTNFAKGNSIQLEDVLEKGTDEVISIITDFVIENYNQKLNDIPVSDEFEKAISLKVIDTNWVTHMSAMEQLKEGIGLRGYAQVNPVQAYTMEGFELFDNFLNKIDNDIAILLLKSEIRMNIQRKQTLEGNDNSSSEKVVNKPKKADKKVGRNSECECGSGKKYKNCCGKNS
ncbi:MAG: preprotein translocase subunit SecA [bacterium]